MPVPSLCCFDKLPLALADITTKLSAVFDADGVAFASASSAVELGKDESLFRKGTFACARFADSGSHAEKLGIHGFTGKGRHQDGGGDIDVFVYRANETTTLLFEEDERAVYDRGHKEEAFEKFVTFLLNVMEAVGANACVYQRANERRAVDVDALLGDIRARRIAPNTPMLAIVRAALLPFDEAVDLEIPSFDADASTPLYSVLSSMTPRHRR